MTGVIRLLPRARAASPDHRRVYGSGGVFPGNSYGSDDNYWGVTRMRLETKFLPLKAPVTIGSRFGEWLGICCHCVTWR